jgi:CopG family nickel-responsive transcriptional regulator
MDARAPAVISKLCGINMVRPIGHQHRQGRKLLQKLLARLGPRKALQQLLQNDARDGDGFAAVQFAAQRYNIVCREHLSPCFRDLSPKIAGVWRPLTTSIGLRGTRSTQNAHGILGKLGRDKCTANAARGPLLMDRFTISLDRELAQEFDELIRERGYASRSEAVRDVLRAHLQKRSERRGQTGHCIATLSYVYNHHERELCERLNRLQHDHHDLTVSTTHAHVDHDQCIENVILKGRTDAVRRFADLIIAERGVRHGHLNLVRVDLGQSHKHGGAIHQHLKPRH